MRISSLQIFRQGTDSLLNNQQALIRSEQQAISGKRVLSPADDPAAASQIERVNVKIRQSEQYGRNNTELVNSLAQEEAQLQSIENALLRSRTLLIQASNGSLNQVDRQAVAKELNERLNEVLDHANGKDINGNYIFSGYAVKQQPFTTVAGTFNTYSYQGDAGQTQVQLSPSVSMAKNDSGAAVFQFAEVDASGVVTGATTNPMNVISEAVAALNGVSGVNLDIDKYIQNLDVAYNQVLEVRAGLGARMNVAEDVKNAQLDSTLADKSQLKDLQEVDYYEAISDLKLRSYGLQVAQSSYAQIQQLSLFNYIR